MTTIEKKKWLEARGFICGERDQNRNRAFIGAFMVAEETDAPLPTDDASDGAFCIVGNDLNMLIHKAFDFVCEMEPS